MKNVSTVENLEFLLTRAMECELPGIQAHLPMAPHGRSFTLDPNRVRLAGVLLSLVHLPSGWVIPTIHRTAGNYPHSGEIGLPGGTCQPGESPIEAALREAREETGILPENAPVIGTLTPVPTSVSQYIVHPCISVLKSLPDWQLDRREVHDLFLVPLSELLNPFNMVKEIRIIDGSRTVVPFFRINGRKIWGVTGLILNELRCIIRDGQ